MQMFSYKTLENGPPNAVYGVDISPDGKMIAAGSLNKGLYIWDTAKGEVRSYPAVHADGVSSVHFSPDGAKVLTTSLDKTIRIFSAQSGVAEITLNGHGEAILSATYLGGSSERFVTTGFDNTVRIWTPSGEVRQMGGLTPYTYSVDGSPDGNWITAGSLSGQVITWSQDGTKLHAATEHEEGVYAVAYSKNNSDQFATGGGRGMVAIWNRAKGEVLGRLRGHRGNIRALAYSHDGRFLASGAHDGLINLWDLESFRNVSVLKGHRNTVYSLAFSHDGRQLISGSFDRRVNVWSLKK